MEKFLANRQLPNLQLLAQVLKRNIVFVDLETTGMVHDYNFAIIEIGLIAISPQKIVESSTFVDPKMRIPGYITSLTGITDSMVNGYPTFHKYSDYFTTVADKSILAGYNSKSFDSKGLQKMVRNTAQDIESYGVRSRDIEFKNQLDIRYLFLRDRANRLGVKNQSGSLVMAAEHHGIRLSGNAHRAGYDIALTALLAEEILRKSGLHAIKEDVLKLHCPVARDSYHNHLNQSSFLLQKKSLNI